MSEQQPDTQLFAMTVTATAEVRDADGNLISSSPVEMTGTFTAAQVAELTGETP